MTLQYNIINSKNIQAFEDDYLAYNYGIEAFKKSEYSQILIISHYLRNEGKFLLELDLSLYAIYSIGAYHLADALKVNNSLEKLNISRCKIGFDGAIALANMLSINNSLKKFYFSYNDWGKDGIIFMLHALENNNSLEEIAIYDEDLQLCNVEIEQLVRKLEGNYSIKRIKWSLNIPEINHILERNNIIC